MGAEVPPEGRFETQVTADHYDWANYNTRGRWSSYWHQIDEVIGLGARTCLVIGSGEGTPVETLRRFGVRVSTVDIADDLSPDIVGDVRALPIEDDAYDVVLCSQVLEHLPFAEVPIALREIRRVTRFGVVLSIPQHGRGWELTLKLPKVRRMQTGGTLPSRHDFAFDGEHYWEVGARNARHVVVDAMLEEVFRIARQYAVPDYPYHRFYVLL